MRLYEILSEGSSSNLFKQYGGKFMKFEKLPLSAQKSMFEYWSEYHDLEDNEFIQQYNNGLYGYVNIPIENLIDVCWNAPDNDMKDDYNNWQEYHDSYWKSEKDDNYQNHLSEMRPVILYDGEGILDGWHRLHWYYKNNIKMIPAIYIEET